MPPFYGGSPPKAYTGAWFGVPCPVHRSGFEFPEEFRDRLQMDLAWQLLGFSGMGTTTHTWGPARAPMLRNTALLGKKMRKIRSDIALLACWWQKVSAQPTKPCQYAHHYHPDWPGKDGYGIDCSNFTSYIYNIAVGINMTAAIGDQAEIDVKSTMAGKLRRIKEWEKMEEGDLVYFHVRGGTAISHCGIVVRSPGSPPQGEDQNPKTYGVVHSTGANATINHRKEKDHSGPQISINRTWWPLTAFSHGFSLADIVKVCRQEQGLVVQDDD